MMATTKEITMFCTNDVIVDSSLLVYQMAGIAEDPNVFDTPEVVGEDVQIVKSTYSARKVVVSDTTGIQAFGLDSILNRPYLYPNSVTWTTSNPRFSLLQSFAFPKVFMDLQNQATHGAFNYHALFKSNFRITCRTDATNYNQGMLIMFAVPGTDTTYDKFSNLNTSTVLNYPHVLFKTGTENEFSLDVPFGNIFNLIPSNHRTDYISSNVYIAVWSPLKAGLSAPSSLSISVWIQPLDTYLAVKTASLIAQSHNTGIIESLVKPVTHLLLDQLPGGHIIGKIAGAFGLYDRVLRDDEQPESARCGDAPVVAVNTKICQLELIPNVSYRYDQKEIVDLVQFAQMPSLGAFHSWTTSRSAGDLLVEYVVGPTSPIYPRSELAIGTVYDCTNIAFVGSTMQYYRGSIEMRIQIVATSFHRGTLFIAFDPYGQPGLTYAQACGLPGISIPISASTNDMTVCLPYSKHADYVETQFPTPEVDHQIGRVYVFVQNALTAPVNVTSEVDILFYFAAGKDAEFRAPVPINKRQVLHDLGGLVWQSKTEQFYENDKIPAGFMVGEHTNILTLLRRPEYMPINNVNFTATAPYSSVSGGRVFSPWHRILSQLFKYNSGGVNVHLVTTTVVGQQILAFFSFERATPYGTSLVPNDYTVTTNDVWMGALHNLNNTPSVNFIVPGYNDIPFHYNVPYTSGAEPYVEQGWHLSIYRSPIGASSISYILGNSVNDDFSLYLPMSVPRIVIPASVELDGLIPIMTSPVVDGYSIGGTRVTNVDKIFNRVLIDGATFGDGNLSEVTINFPSGNTTYVDRMYASITGPSDVPGLLITFNGTIGGTGTVIQTFSSYEELNGYTSLDPIGATTNPGYYDEYFITFTKTGAGPWNVNFGSLQLFAKPTSFFEPQMIDNDAPAPYQTSASSGNAVAFNAYDNDNLTQWRPSIYTIPQSVYIAGLTDFKPAGVIVRGNAVDTTSGFTQLTIYVTDSNLVSPPWTQVFTGPISLIGSSQRSITIPLRTDVKCTQLRVSGSSATGPAAPGLSLDWYSNFLNPQIATLRNDGSFAIRLLPQMEKIIPQGITSIVSGGLASLQAAIRSITNTLNTARTLVSGVNAMTDIATRCIKLFKTMLNVIMEFVGIVSNLHSFLKSENSVMAALAASAIAHGVYKLASSAKLQNGLAPQGVDSAFQSFYQSVVKYSAEAGELVLKYFEPSTLLSYFGGIFRRFGFRVDQAHIIYHREIAKSDNFLSALVHTLLSMFFEGDAYMLNSDIALGERVAKSVTEVKKMVDDFDLYGKFHYGSKIELIKDHIVGIREDIVQFRKESVFTKPARNGHEIVQLEKMVGTLVEKISRAQGLSARVEPVSIYFTGSSGVGKTLFTSTILPIVVNGRLAKHPKYRHVDFTRKLFSDSKYDLVHTYIPDDRHPYDSLCANQPWFVMDDAFTDRASADGVFLTRLVNAAPMEVPKADIESKGTIYQCQFVVINSNEKDPVKCAAETMNSASKVLRRLGMMIAMEFKVGKSVKDIATILDDISSDDFEDVERTICERYDSVYNFVEYKYMENGFGLVKGRNIGCKEIFDYVQDKFEKNHGFTRPVLNKIASLSKQGDEDEFHIADEGGVNVEPLLMRLINHPDETAVKHIATLLDEPACEPNRGKTIRQCLLERLPAGVFDRLFSAASTAGSAVVDTWWGAIHYMTQHPALVALLGTLTVACVGTLYSTLKGVANNVGCLFQNLVYDNKAVRQSVAHIAKSRLVPQDFTMEQAEQEKAEKIRKNIVRVGWGNGIVLTSKMHATFLNANTLLMNAHFFTEEISYLDRGLRIYISQPGVSGLDLGPMKVVSIPPDQRCSLGGDLDLVVCKLCVDWPNIRDITQFVSQVETKNKIAVLLGVSSEDDIVCTWEGTTMINEMGGKSIRNRYIEFKHNGDRVIKTQHGDCGRPYYVMGIGVLGLHSAITDDWDRGAAVEIPKVYLAKRPQREVKFEGVATENKFWFAPTPIYAQVKINDVKQEHFTSNKTQYRKIEPELVRDEECDYRPSQKVPCVVNGELVSPLLTGSQKWYTNQVSPVPYRNIRQFAKYFATKFPVVRDQHLLSDFEMINGFGSMDGVRMQTSSGFWNKFFTGGKKEIFSALPQEVIEGETQPLKYTYSDRANEILPSFGKSFVEIVASKEKNIRTGIVPDFVFLATLKDELRPAAKVEQGITRVFEQSSLDMVLLLRKYFGAFINHYRVKAGFTYYHGIGRDKDGVWGKYAEGLRENSNLGHCFDYKNFDGSLPAECYTFFAEVTDLYYSDSCSEDRMARHSLLSAMQNGLHVCGHYVFETSQGNKSGNAFTDVFNSVSNTFLMWTAFIAHQISVLGIQSDISQFDKQIKMLTYGDDVVMTIKPPLLNLGFDGKFIQQVMEELGMTITSANKKDEIERFMQFSELTFLKSPFVYDKELQIWKAPLPIKDILKELKYRPKKASYNEGDMEQRLQNVVRFLAHHDRATYAYWVATLIERGADCNFQSWDFYNFDIKLKQSRELPLH